MLKTKGVVLHHFPYNDTHHIVHILTEGYGRMVFSVAFGSGKRAIAKRNLFQPLALLELETEPAKAGGLHRLKDVRVHYTPVHTPFDPVKTTIVLFLAELLHRTLHEEGVEQRELYFFVENNLLVLDLTEASVANFPLLFLYQYISFLGFRPSVETYSPNAYFDLREGHFSHYCPVHGSFVNPDLSRHLLALDTLSHASLSTLQLSRKERSWLLEALVEYLSLHTSKRSELKSLAVLQSIF